MTEQEAQKSISEIPVGGKLQLLKKNCDIVELVLASHELQALEEKVYGKELVPEMPPALIVQGKRWGTFRQDLDQIVSIAHIE